MKLIACYTKCTREIISSDKMPVLLTVLEKVCSQLNNNLSFYTISIS